MFYHRTRKAGSDIPTRARVKNLSVEIRVSEKLSEEERRTLFGWGENIFGAEDLRYRWRPKDVHLVLEEGGRVVSHIGLLRHAVSAGGRTVEVAGVGGVVTVPEAQGRGHAQRGMRHAAEFFCREWGVEFGLLFCGDALVAFYERLGWQPVPEPVVIEQPDGPVESAFHVLVLPCDGRAWPAGEVRLESFPW
jgi:GNAT superfamily N-acetyltransferase